MAVGLRTSVSFWLLAGGHLHVPCNVDLSIGQPTWLLASSDQSSREREREGEKEREAGRRREKGIVCVQDVHHGLYNPIFEVTSQNFCNILIRRKSLGPGHTRGGGDYTRV